MIKTATRWVGLTLALALAFGLQNASAAHADSQDWALAGTWVFKVAPQPKPPEVPEPPRPFTAFFSFAEGGTSTETDTALHPGGRTVIFPDQDQPYAASDGLGSWKRTSWNHYVCTFVKILFSQEGEQIGYVVTRFKIGLTGAHTLSGRSESDFVLGPDPDGEPFFSGGVSLAKGWRLPAQ